MHRLRVTRQLYYSFASDYHGFLLSSSGGPQSHEEVLTFSTAHLRLPLEIFRASFSFTMFTPWNRQSHYVCLFYRLRWTCFNGGLLLFGDAAWRMAVMTSQWRSRSRTRRSRLVSCWMSDVVTRERASRKWSCITANSDISINID